MKAYYFSSLDCKLRYDDNRLIAAGTTHTVERPNDIKLCSYGLHAGKSAYDALQYAPGPMLWRVELGGVIIKGDNKIVTSERTYLKGFDSTDLLRKFTRMCALDVLHLWDAPQVVVQYLKTGDDSLRAAARAAALGVGPDAAAAWGAARAAAWAAAWVDSWAAARDAARAAGWAACAAAEKKQRQRLARMINAEFKKLENMK